MSSMNKLKMRPYLFLAATLAVAAALASCGRTIVTAPDTTIEQDSAPADTATAIRPIAQPLYSASAAMTAIMLDGSNYAYDTSRRITFFKYSPNGTTWQMSGFTPYSFQLTGMPVKGVRLDENAASLFAQCVALPKAKGGAPATTYWRAGGRVVDGAGTAGTGIAVFDASGKYVGTHAAILLRRYADGSIDVVEQNVPLGYGIRIRHIARTNKGGINDSAAYSIIVHS